MTAFLAVSCGVLGLAVGSFLNVVVHRVPRGESVVRPRSRCPGCSSELRSRDNIPVVSWLLLRGRCRTCGMAISPRYPLIELGTGLLFAAFAARFGADWALGGFLAWGAGLIALSAVDLERYLLPKKILYPTLFLSAAFLVVAAAVHDEWGSAREAAIGGVAGFAFLFVIHVISPGGMGFGDVRLAGLNGMALGWLTLGHVVVGMFLGFISAAVVGVALIATKVRGRKDKVPFGPFLALGAVAAVFVGQAIVDWYV